MTGKLLEEEKSQAQVLGSFLGKVRTEKGLTLRQVEEATGKDVSNAYLSQLEHGRINKPSPNVLHSLASVYGISYEVLMEMAGYIMKAGDRSEGEKHGRIATLALENLTQEEEEKVLEYVAFLRSKRRKS
jgi:transcriptional regulator with XRE-family HTH domain